MRRTILALAILTAPAVGAVTLAPAVVEAPSAAAQARPTSDAPLVYCGPGYYPPQQYNGRCVAIKRIALAKPSFWKPWMWRF